MRRLAVVLLLTLAACSSATSGQGSAGPSLGATPSAPSSAPPSSAPSSVSSSVSAPPVSSPAPSTSVASPTALGCPAGSIDPSGAPFCYPLPTGFTDFSSRPDYANEWSWRTLIGAGGSDLIEVLASLGASSFDRFSDAQLRDYFNRAGLIEKGKLGFASVGPVLPTRLAGARAFRQNGVYSSGVRAELFRGYLGRTIVFVSCQAKVKLALVNAACLEVVSRLKIART